MHPNKKLLTDEEAALKTLYFCSTALKEMSQSLQFEKFASIANTRFMR